MKKLIIIMFISGGFFANSQEFLDLDTCIEISINNHPTHKNKYLNKQVRDLTIKNNISNFLPNLSFEGKATYQSEAFSLDIEFPDIPGFDISLPQPPLDQYNLSVNLNQLIWDGGRIKHLNAFEYIKYEAEQKKTDIDLYNLREQIENNYFSILILQESESQLVLTINELNQKKKSVKSAVDNGTLTHDNYDILLAEILKLEQNLTELQENKKAGIRILEEFMSEELSEDIKLILPKNTNILTDSIRINRPENELFNIQTELLNKQEKLLSSNRMPFMGAFAQAGYGNPGLTMVNDEWTGFYIIGAKLSWTIWDRNKTEREKEILKINQGLINNRMESFDKSVMIQAEKYLAEISKLQKIIEKDDEIIQLQENICNTAESKLLNGIITSTEYIKLVNDKSRSIIKKDMHSIQLIQAKRNYLRTIGN
jgi:outer membrane protein TolC